MYRCWVFFCLLLVASGCWAQTTTAADIRSIEALIPPRLGVWPLNEMFANKDASTNGNDATFTSGDVILTTNYHGLANRAYELHSAGSAAYITLNSPTFSLGNSSWSLLMYVNTGNQDGAIFEFEEPGPVKGASLWQAGLNRLEFDPDAGDPITSLNCAMDDWQFVAILYHGQYKNYRIFCNSTYGPAKLVDNAPTTSAKINIGYSPLMGSVHSVKVSCVVFFDARIGWTQLVNTKRLCQYHHAFACSDNCPGSCDGDMSKPAGYSCNICAPSWSGSDCLTPVCSPACPAGDNCVAPNVCAHSTGVSMCTETRNDQSLSCPSWANAQRCLSDPSFTWSYCPASCAAHSSCACDTIISSFAPTDDTCECGEAAFNGGCETLANVTQACNYTCGRRLESKFNCTTYPQGVSVPSHSSWSLSAPSAGYFSGRSAFLQTATMLCDLGYEPDDIAKTGLYICNPFEPNVTSGNWHLVNPNEPVCSRVVCPNLPPSLPFSDIINYTALDSFYFGDRVTYNCTPGYIMTEATVPDAFCTLATPESAWSYADRTPTCVLPPCGDLPEGINVYYNVSNNHTGGVATYRCVTGYGPSTPLPLFVKICQGDATWLPEGEPKCEIVICPDPVEEENSHIVNKKYSMYEYGDEITYLCNTGAVSMYIEPGTEAQAMKSLTKTCLSTGDWTTGTIGCLLVQCPKPQQYEISKFRMMNSTASLRMLLYSTIIAFECDWNKAYEPDENQTMNMVTWFCNENGTWDKQDLKCSQKVLLDSLDDGDGDSGGDSQVAVVAGSLIFALLSFFLGVIVCLDYMTLARDFKRLRHNLTPFFRLMRDRGRARELREVRNRMRQKVSKQNYLKTVEDKLESQRLARHGLVTDMEKKYLVPNPLAADDMPGSSVDDLNGGPKTGTHVEAEMDLPEDITLRLGLSAPPGKVLADLGVKKN